MSYERDVAKFSKSLKDVIKKARDNNMMADLGNAAIDIIQRRTWSGKGVAKPGGNLFTLKALSTKGRGGGYVGYRKRNRSRLSPMTTPTKSNLTFTGQMLYSLAFKPKSKNIVIRPEGTRDDGKTNAQIARYVSEKRPFMFLADSEQKFLRDFFSRQFDELTRGI